MKQLLLLRHAKAESEPALDDLDRPLSLRGKRDATAMGAVLRRHALIPQLILCSPSLRTRSTLALLAPALGEPAIRIEETLYLASWKEIFDRLTALERGLARVLVIGHNPGLADCAAMMLNGDADREERTRRALMVAKFPTCALAVIELPVTAWTALVPKSGTLSTFLRPKDLPGLR
jgi:phosphohistidine phosphatase